MFLFSWSFSDEQPPSASSAEAQTFDPAGSKDDLAGDDKEAGEVVRNSNIIVTQYGRQESIYYRFKIIKANRKYIDCYSVLNKCYGILYG